MPTPCASIGPVSCGLRERIVPRAMGTCTDKVGAGSETRTRTLSPEPDFESGASTNSAIPALKRPSISHPGEGATRLR